MIRIQDLYKSFGTQVIYEGISLQINKGDRFALMGPNGSGKSTLFKLILGMDSPDEGVISSPRGTRIGYLPQETAEFHEGTVLEETIGLGKGFDEAGENAHRHTAEAKKILMGLGFRLSDFDRKVSALSGGWQMRVAIARLLLQNPDLLLLDEPTNHLDLESLFWFQDYLQKWRGSVLVISHDRAFVNSLVDGILELRRHKLYRYKGNYERFLEQRQQEEEQLIAAYKKQQKEIQEMESFIARFRAQASKAPQVQSRIKALNKIERIEILAEEKKVKIRFPQPTRCGLRALKLVDVDKSYGETKVYKKLNFEMERGQRIILAGPNGAGKSTLLKILAGVLPFESGTRELGLNVQSGYFAQHRVEMLDSDRTVLEEAMDTKRMNPDLFVRTVLGTFLFRDNTVYKKVKVLSGGEKSRLALVKLLLDPPNVLLLDEPTTHLDMASVDALVEALKAFEGTICFISHDLYFINALADHVVHVDQGKLTIFPGNYDYFQRRQQQKKTESNAPQEHFYKSNKNGKLSLQEPIVKSSSEDLRNYKQAERIRSKARKKINAKIRSLQEDIAVIQEEMSSNLIQSDYEKLMDLDQSVKRLEKELEEKRGELSKLN